LLNLLKGAESQRNIKIPGKLIVRSSTTSPKEIV
jgi:hypothetical protein